MRSDTGELHPAAPDPSDSAVPAPVEVGVLGAVVTRVDGTLTAVPGGRARTLLVALALDSGRSRSVAALVEEVWPGEPPRSPKNALQTQVSRLRSVLPKGMLESSPAGYRLVSTPGQVDLEWAHTLAGHARTAAQEGRLDAALDTVRAARSLWRGEPGGDLPASALTDELARRAESVARELDRTETEALLARRDFAGALPLISRARERDRSDERAAADLMRCLHGLGRTNDALTVFADLRRELASSLGTDPSPALVELNAELLTPPVAHRPVGIGLRAGPNTLLGRDADIHAVEALMTRSRVTTVLGPGGSGKTRLAHELGLRALRTRPVAFVELASLRHGHDIAAAIITALGLSETDPISTRGGMARVHTARERVRDAFGADGGLLVLDNCEHLVDDVARTVDELISDSEHLTILTTSRSPLSITAESTYPLPPLQVEGADSSAVELFVSRARAARPSARFDVDEVRKLCRTLDGLPLAIELAAARVRTMTVAEIDARLEHRFALLRSSDRTRPERHRTLHAVIEWSWDLLTPTQRAALTRLCRFPAGFTLAAAEQVAAERGAGGDLFDAVDGLVGQSLLSVVDDGEHVRYHMLETVREFGEERLSERDADEVTARILDWGADVAASAVAGFRGPEQQSQVFSVEAEHDNLVDILRQALARGSWRHAYATFSTLAYFWSMRGAHSEVYTWAARIAAAPSDGPEVADVVDDHLVLAHILVISHLAYISDMRGGVRMRSRLRRITRDRHSIDPGLRFVAELLMSRADGRGIARALAVATRSPVASVRNVALLVRASMYENSANLYQSARDSEAAKAVARERGDSWALAVAAQALGGVRGQSGGYEEAIENYLLAADVMWELRSYDESMQVRGFVGAAMIAAGRIAEGRSFMASLTERPADARGTVEADPDHEDQRLASVTAALAEADIAEGQIESGLAKYRRSVQLSAFSVERQGDPYLTMLASASVSAHALHGGTDMIENEAALLEKVAAVRLGPDGFRDLPQLGAVACAIGSYDIESGRDPHRGIRLLAASVTVHARHDYPAMNPSRHLVLAREILGDDVVDDAVAEAANRTRAEAVTEIRRLLRP